MHAFSLLFLVMLLLSAATGLYLSYRQLVHVRRHRTQVPEAFSEKISLESHTKAADYTITKTKVGMVAGVYSVGILLLWTFGGGLNTLDQFWRETLTGPVMTGVAFMLSVFLITALLELPFTVYNTFRVEQRFGFNRTTPALFLTDMIKQGLLLLLLGAPLAALVIWLMANAGEWWWFYVWAVWLSFSLLMQWAYPAVIAPLFNKFTPLDDEALVHRIETLLTRCGFSSKGVFVMDGSKRSAHGNAYFGGLGNNKRIVFFDTLLNVLNHDEIEAVLAHELGHFKRKHVRKLLFTVALFSLGGLAVLGWLIQKDWFYQALGVDQPSVHAALVLFMMVAPVFTFFIQPLLAAAMRKHEFEADDFAAEQTRPGDLVSALVKLYEENASTLTPDPLYSAFHDSHPPAPVRVSHLSAKMPQITQR